MNVLPTVWEIGALLIVLLCGVVARLSGLIPVSAIEPYNKLIFTFGIPCLAFNAMATHSVQTLDWTFVLIFLSIRAIAAIIAAIYTICTHGTFGDFAVHYLAPTWIDVITFGVPIIKVMFTTEIGEHYPVLAAFSSFIFELPLVLICLEIYRIYAARRRYYQKLEREQSESDLWDVLSNDGFDSAKKSRSSDDSKEEPLLTNTDNSNREDNDNEDNDNAMRKRSGHNEGEEENENEGNEEENEDEKRAEEEVANIVNARNDDSQSQIDYVDGSVGEHARRIAIFVGKRLLHTPPIIAIVLGLIYGSIQIPLPKILERVISYLGALVTPIASFTVGMFVCDGKPFRRAWRKTIVYMILKMFAMPLLALLVVYISGIKNPAAEVAVIIASLPLAFPAFTITKQYGLGEDVMSTCITTGTILMLPTVLFWWWVVEAIDIFPNPTPAPTFNSSSSSELLNF